MTNPAHLLLPLLLLGSAALAAPDPVADILAANRKATGGAVSGAATVALRYEVEGQGMQGTVAIDYDAGSGAFSEDDKIGPTHEGSGFDGNRAWMMDLSGAITPQDGGDRRQLAVNDAYRYANLWWRPGYDGAEIAFVGHEADGDHLKVAPKGGKLFDAWFDAKTHFLTRIFEVTGFNTEDVRYSDYRQMAGEMRAATWVTDGGNGPDALFHWRLADARKAPRSRSFATAFSVPDDHHIAKGGASVTVPMRLANNHIFIDVKVDGKGPFPFILDTGGHDIITPSTLEALALKSEGSSMSGGAGEKKVAGGYAHVDRLEIGGLNLTDQTLFNFSPKAIEGFEIGGMIGFETFRRYVVKIDYGANQVTFTDPARFDPAGAGQAIPFRLYDHQPEIEGRFGDLPARLLLDTGSRSEVTLTTPYIAANKLRDAHPEAKQMIDGWGVGGPSRSLLIRGQSISLGSVTVPSPIAGLATQNKGVFTDENFDGNVGSGLLKRFIATFDYNHLTLYLDRLPKPNADFGSFDRGGLWINLGEKGFDVVSVVAEGPAQQAGLKEGDVITAIGGRSADSLSLSDARREFRTLPAGKAVKVDYLREGKSGSVQVTPRDLL